MREHYPDIDYELLMLDEMNLGQCRGCYTCILKGEDKCPLKDDRDMIIGKMLDADGVVFASPVYAIHVSSLMKSFIERISYYSHRPRFYDKFASVMVTCSGYGGKDAAKYLESIFSSFGFNVASSLELHFRPGKMPEEQKTENREKTVEAFDTLIARIQKGERNKPSLGLLVPFTLFKEVSMLDRETMEADYEYYKDKTDYYYDTKINPLKKWLAKRIVKKILSKA